MYNKKVIIIGIGYVGLPLALILAKNGVKVTGVDINKKIVEQVNNGTMKFNEEIDKLFSDKKVKENFHATTTPETGDVFIIAVPTPIDHKRKISDLFMLREAIKSICPFLSDGNLLIIESTIPPLTCQQVVSPIIEKHTDLKVNSNILIAHCPERILPGNIYNELINNPRIIGGMNKEASIQAKKLYKLFVKGEIRITDDVTAELSKLVENSYRDVNIAFANEISQVAEKLSVSPSELIKLANMHPRVNILNPGIGVGGHCIAVDPWFIKEIDNDNTKLIQTARMINDKRPSYIVNKILKILGEKKLIQSDMRLVLLGAAYKPNVSDTRESPALKIYDLFVEMGFKVIIKDPLVPQFSYNDISDIVNGSDIIIILVKHDKVLLDIKKIKEKFSDMLVIDLT